MKLRRIVVREEGKKCGCIEKGVCFFKKLTATLCTMAVPL